MKRKLNVFLAAVMALQMTMAGVVTVHAEDETPANETYTAPESSTVTYNMNIDWKFYDCKTDAEIRTAMSKADKDGKRFYEVDYDDSEWETVSIPHGIGGGTNSFANANTDAGGGYRSVLLYRKTITVPEGDKFIFELEGIRQAAYVWVNGEKVGYYEAGITAMGFDVTNYVTPGEEAVIAICNDGTTARGTTGRIPYETVPGEEWGSSYTPDNYKTAVGKGSQYQWNTKDFNEPQIGLVYDAYLHVSGNVYQTRPLYNNLKTMGNYIYADNFDIKARTATINVDAEIRNESDNDGDYTLEVAVVDAEGKLRYNFSSDSVTVKKASDKGVVYQTAVENDVYDIIDAGIEPLVDTDNMALYNGPSRPDRNADNVYLTYNETWGNFTQLTSSAHPEFAENGHRLKYGTLDSKGKFSESKPQDIAKATHSAELIKVTRITHYEINATKVNTVDVTHITASFTAEDMRFWSTDDPYMYTVYTILRDSEGNAVDVQKKETGFRKVTYDENSGILINDKAVWMPGYAQRSTNEWAVIGTATDWLQDYDMSLIKDNNSNFIRWMHVAPKPFEVRSSDRYGVAVVCPAGDKEGAADGRQWSQRVEAMRDAMIYFRNNPSVIFWETGNSAVCLVDKAEEMAAMRNRIDPKGMRFIGARSTQAADQLNYDYNYAGTMYGNYGSNAINAMKQNGKMGPIMETEYARDESPRRVWDLYSPPDFDYVNKFISFGGKMDGYDVWNKTQEQAVVDNIREYNGYYANRAGYGNNIYSAAAMMIWSDSNMHTRNTATENCRTSGRVDPVRQTKEMFEGTKAAQSNEPAIHIVGHWSYPELTEDTYNYYGTQTAEIDANHKYEVYVTDKKYKRDPKKKTVYAIGSAGISKVELYRLDGETETLIGTDENADSNFIYQFDNIDVTVGDGVIAKAYDVRGNVVTTDEIARTYDAVNLRLTPHTAVKENEDGTMAPDWRADGADIAYIDVEVIDKNGNVCALNYDKISFSYSGEGVYLGGYNSGSGAGCFQNTNGSKGLSNYFGGIKDGVSTIGKDYVYAENGTNRIFVRSTRNAGSFTLNASMDIAGMLPVSVTINSEAVEVNGGLTTAMASRLSPDAGNYVPPTSVPALKPLMLTKHIMDWTAFKTVKKGDDKDAYAVYVNGTKLELAAVTYVGTMDNIFGPAYEIVSAVKAAGGTGFDIAYAENGGRKEVVVTATDGSTYHYPENSNQYYINGNISDTNECVDSTVMENGVLVANLTQILGWAGINYTTDTENKTLNITVQ